MRNLFVPLVLVSTGLLAGTGSVAARDPAVPEFNPPVRLKAGDKYIGEKRSYPSPVLRDMNGDGHLDLVTGDLRGLLTVALRKGEGLEFEPESELKGADGKPLKFDNW